MGRENCRVILVLYDERREAEEVMGCELLQERRGKSEIFPPWGAFQAKPDLLVPVLELQSGISASQSSSLDRFRKNDS